uniref:Uncharacterized protein n=1 Tax=Branchiostoma floridae TaxID=7739 RepID=C3YXG8_BRAFL|eukprot:XP_002598765.1 hypothetical protein BRAFLDRAFT_74557 [Branchiostoma floridae]
MLVTEDCLTKLHSLSVLISLRYNPPASPHQEEEMLVLMQTGGEGQVQKRKLKENQDGCQCGASPAGLGWVGGMSTEPHEPPIPVDSSGCEVWVHSPHVPERALPGTGSHQTFSRLLEHDTRISYIMVSEGVVLP